MNICGVLVHAMPSRIEEVSQALAFLDGVEVHQVAEGGRIVVTLEDTPTSSAVDQLASVHRIEGVVAAALVYHHFEPASKSAEAA
ncbi:MAG: chaperone NapD [Hyphomicrobiaceae bacterium]